MIDYFQLLALSFSLHFEVDTRTLGHFHFKCQRSHANWRLPNEINHYSLLPRAFFDVYNLKSRRRFRCPGVSFKFTIHLITVLLVRRPSTKRMRFIISVFLYLIHSRQIKLAMSSSIFFADAFKRAHSTHTHAHLRLVANLSLWRDSPSTH